MECGHGRVRLCTIPIRNSRPRAWRWASAKRAGCRHPIRLSRTISRRARRGTALSLFNLGPPLGQALGIAFGASIAAAYSWRSAFVAIGVDRRLHGVRSSGSLCASPSAARSMRFSEAGSASEKPASRQNSGRQCKHVLHAIAVLLRLSTRVRRATQIVTYGILNFTTLFPHAREGYDPRKKWRVYYALLDRRLHQRGHVPLRPI
jgi:hypothetical protein